MRITIRIRRSFIKQLLLGTIAITILGTVILNARVAGIDEDGKYFETNTILENISNQPAQK